MTERERYDAVYTERYGRAPEHLTEYLTAHPEALSGAV